MFRKVTYICTMCGAGYDTEQEASACERYHSTLSDASLLPLYHTREAEPYKITVTFSDGRVTDYIRKQR